MLDIFKKRGVIFFPHRIFLGADLTYYQLDKLKHFKEYVIPTKEGKWVVIWYLRVVIQDSPPHWVFSSLV